MKPHAIAVLQALFVVFLWATSWVFVKIGLQDIPPVTFAGLRYFLAFLCLLVVLLFNRSRRELKELSKSDWLRFLLLGILLYAGTQGAVFVALAYLPAVTVNLLWSFSSVAIALLGAALLSERPRVLQWLGMGLAVLGAVIYFYPVDIPQNQTLGLIVAFVGALANAFASILGRDINRLSRYSPLVITVISMGAGSVLLLGAGLAVEQTPTLDLQSWGIVLWLALVNTAFAFTLWNHTLRTLTAMESSIINGTMLVWVALFAVLFLGETITGKEAVGLIAASLGTIIVQVRRIPPIDNTPPITGGRGR
jgi:drug/metabolite transporter (DMT)-like permease